MAQRTKNSRGSRSRSSRSARNAAAGPVIESLEQRMLLSVPVTSYSNVPLSPPPALPAKYGVFVDPDFGTQIIRVTDSSNGTSNHIAYSYWPTFNKDSTYFHFNRNGSAVLYSLNPQTCAVAYVGPLFAVNPPTGGKPNWEDSVWSPTDPNSIIGHNGPRLWSYNVVTHVYTLIKDFTGTPGWNTGETVGQFSRSADENVFAFTKKSATYQAVGYEVWKRDTNTYPVLVSTTQLDEVQIDKSGAYLVVKTGLANFEKVKVFTIATGTYVDLCNGSPDYAPGHSDNGSGMVVGFENQRNYTNMRSLATPHTFTNIFMPPGANEGGSLWQDGHISMLRDGDQWALHSKILTGTSTKTGPFLNELFLVATDGRLNDEGKTPVIRVAHHRSKVTVQNNEYWEFPMANISRDGRFVAFNSDWNDSGQRDVFILRMPIPGDANMDYLVNQADYDIWAAHNGMTSGATWDLGDWDADHDVDAADLALWQQNQTGGTSVTISATDANAGEAATPDTGTFRVTRAGSTTSDLTVNYSIGGSAANTSDYSTLGTTVVIPAGSTTATITITPINDTLIEGSETAILTITTGTGYAVGTPSSATVTIADDDLATVTISATTPSASEAGPVNGAFRVTRAGTYQGTSPALTVNYSKSGTAASGSDYSALGTTVVIPSGSTTATITLAVIDDTLIEGSETAILTLAAGTGYTIGSPLVATVTIADNDALPGAPGNLTATPGNNTIALSWSAAAGNVQGYHVERSRDGGAWSLVQTLGPAATSWLDTARSPVPTYSYRISAYNASGEGPYSGTAGAQALGVPGDGNGDGVADATDYAAWFNNYGKTPTGISDGDFNDDGAVDATDYSIWSNNYGTGGSSGVTVDLLHLATSLDLRVLK